jgi:ArsR family transcriptional regulator
MALPARQEPADTGREPLDRDAAETLARTLRAVADPTRLQVLSMLAHSADEEATVTDLAVALGLTQPTVTHHLKILVEDGILDRERRGKHVWHRLSPERRAAVLDLVR